MVKKLEPAVIEHIHDVLVGVFLPFSEQVNPFEYRSLPRIESAAARPFQTAFGTESWETIPQKAAVLFHSLVCFHCFINGNKRTAVIALDLFLAINGYLLAMSSDEVYQMAKETATANQDGRKDDAVMSGLARKIETSAVDIETLRDNRVRDRMGEREYGRIMTHVDRLAAFAQRVISIPDQNR